VEGIDPENKGEILFLGQVRSHSPERSIHVTNLSMLLVENHSLNSLVLMLFWNKL
jgi:hypothetical protein